MADKPNSKQAVQRSRRKLLTMLSIGAAASKLPDSWSKPTVASVMLPAHAQSTLNCAFETSSNPITGEIQNTGGSLSGTGPPGTGTISGGVFSLSGTQSISCPGSAGALLLTINGSVPGPWSGTENLYCGGTLFGYCVASGSASYYNGTNITLSGNIFCTVCTGFAPT